MTSPILVTGGTGTLGRQVVSRLRDGGHDVRVLSRHQHGPADGVQYVTGGLLQNLPGMPRPLMDGAQVIVHCAG